VDRLNGVLLITDAKPGSLPTRDPAMLFCDEDRHLWVHSFSGGGYFCSNCAARLQENFLRDFIALKKLGPIKLPGGLEADTPLLLDDVFKEYLRQDREKTMSDFEKPEEYVPPRRPVERHSIILGTTGGRGSLWDTCKIDGRELYASRAKVDLEPGSIPTVELTVHAHHLKEYLDEAHLDLAIVQLDGSVTRIDSAAFVKKEDEVRPPKNSVEVKLNVNTAKARSLLRDIEDRLREEIPKLVKANLDRSIPIRTGSLSSLKKGK
jgi:hypothetical protein